MTGFINKLSSLIRNGIGATEDDYNHHDYDARYEDDDYYDGPEDIQPQPPKHDPVRRNDAATGRGYSRSSLSNKVIELGYAQSAEGSRSESVIAHPVTISDAVEICSHVKSGRMVIVDLTGLEHIHAQRIADYLSGVCQSLDGDTQRVNNGIFTISPKNHRVTNDYRKEITPAEDHLFPTAMVAER